MLFARRILLLPVLLLLCTPGFGHSQAQEGDTAPEVKALIEKLGARDVNVRRTAAEALGRQRDKVAVPALVKSLTDSDGHVRAYAAASLGQLEDKAGVAGLLKRIADEKYEVNWEKDAALTALRALDLDKVSEALLQALRSGNRDVRLWAAQRLSTQRDRDVVEALLKSLDDKDGDLRKYAADSLGKIGDRTALSGLVRRVADERAEVSYEKDVTLTALRTLDPSKVTGALLSALKSENRNVRLWAVQQLASQKEPTVVTALIDTLGDKDGELRKWAADSLGKIGDRSAVPALVKRVMDEKAEVGYEKDVTLAALRILDLSKITEALLGALKSENRDVRLWAAQQLATQKEKVVVEALVAALTDKDGDLRRYAADSLGKIGDESAVPVLIKRVMDEKAEASYEKDAALNALRILDLSKVTEALLGALQSENRAVRLWAVQKLVTQKEKVVTEALLKVLGGKDGELRAYAADSLGKLEDTTTVPALVRRVSDDENEVSWEKDAALTALRKLDVARVSEALVAALRSRTRSVRLWAVQRLASQWDKVAVAALIETLGDKEGDLRGYAADSLGKLGARTAVPALVRRITDDALQSNWEKDVALGALKKLAPEKVRETLIEAAKSKNNTVKTWATAQLGALK